MSTLPQRLADLADDATHDDHHGPGGDLWAQGRRYARRRRIETAALSLVLVGALGSLVGALLPPASYDAGPADAVAPLRLPDQIERPSSWLRGTDDTGPLGPVVAVFAATRSSGLLPQEDTGLVAVAASGEYAFLDLPDGAPSSRWVDKVALSADGRRLAYPLAGDTREEPNTTEGGGTVVGLGVYDTLSGDVQRLEVPTDHGILLDDLTWVGDTIRFSYGHYVAGAGETDEGVATGIHGYAWDVTREPVRAVRAEGAWAISGVTPDAQALRVDRRRVRVLPGDDGAGAVDVRLDVLPEPDVALNVTGDRLALLEDTDGVGMSDGTTQPLRVATLPASGTGAVTTSPVGDVEASTLRGWRDDQHVVVEDLVEHSLDSVDVDTGARDRLTGLPTFGGGTTETVFAQDALRAPTFDADGAPYVMPPLLRLGLAVLAVLLAGAGVLLWRRRGRV